MTASGERTGQSSVPLVEDSGHDDDFTAFLDMLNSSPEEDQLANDEKKDDITFRDAVGEEPSIKRVTTGVTADSSSGSEDVKDAAAAVAVLPGEDEGDGDAVLEKESHYEEPWRRRDMYLEFASLSLFFLGSVLYMVLAVEDHAWAHKLLGMPMYVRIADDDITWYRYQYDRKYNETFGRQDEDVASNATAARMLEGQEVAVSRAGGVRMMKMRELYRLEEEIREMEASKKMRELFGLEEETRDVATRSLERRLQTPEELYYILCWAELPPEIQDAYAVLGYNEDVWDNGGETELSVQLADSWWEELTDEQREAAEFIGYTMEMWNVDENGNPISPPEPTAEPVAVAEIQSTSPTGRPTPLPVTGSPTKQPTPMPVTDSPTKRPTLQPVTDSPTKKPTPQPVTGDPTGQPSPKPVTTGPTSPVDATEPASTPDEEPSRDVLYWYQLSEGQKNSLSLLGYSETLWNGGATLPVEADPWSSMTSQEKFGAFFFGYSKESWDAAAPGEKFAFRPPKVEVGDAAGDIIFDNQEEDVLTAVLTTFSPTPKLTPDPTVATPPPSAEPTKKPTVEPTEEPTSKPSTSPTKMPSHLPTAVPTRSPVTVTPTSAAPVPAPVQTVLFTPDPIPTSPSSPATPEAELDATATKPTPEELYYDEYWKDLPSKIQDAYAVLGLNETSWNLALPTETDDLWWHELSAAQREAALFIGYTEEIWCETIQPTTSPTPPKVAQIVQSPAAAEAVPDESTPVLPASPPLSDTGKKEMSAPSDEALQEVSNTPATDPQAPTAPTPEELYYDEFWADLPPEIQDAYSMLGFNEAAWNLALPTKADDYWWHELPQEMKEAAIFIGYTEEMWCATVAPTISPGNATSVPGNETDEATISATVRPGFYDIFAWSQLPPHIKDAGEVLGYNQNMWDMGVGVAWSDEYGWDELPPKAKQAAALFGYDKYSWDCIDPVTGAAVVETAAGDDWIVYDDDYLFQVGSAEADVWVSKYQIIYFFAALCFLILGILDLIREKDAFHVIMIVAGALGVLSAVFIEENISLSNTLSAVSVHFYLLEFIVWFRKHKKAAALEGYDLWEQRAYQFADWQLVVGGVLDVVLSYIYLFDHTADWDVSLTVVFIAASIMWLNCSLIYLGLFIYEAYDYHEEQKNRSTNSTFETSEEDRSDLQDARNNGSIL